MKFDLKERKGITIITLVITIVILLILAGITINAITGENGLINKTKVAKSKTNKSNAQEELQLKITQIQMDEYVESQQMPTLEKLGRALGDDKGITYVTAKSKKSASKNVCDIENWTNISTIYTKLKNYDYEFGINDSLQIASIDGVSIITNTADTSGTGLSTEQYNSLKQELLSDLTKSIYPVGYIYMSTENTDPGTLFGGTWEKYGEGKTIVGEGTGTDDNSESKTFTAGTTGGEYKHKLTVSEMPSHNHNFAKLNFMNRTNGSGGSYIGDAQYFLIGGKGFANGSYLSVGNIESSTIQINSTGNNQSHINIQPYIVTYMWKKVSN